jgi:hypothetical protein
MQLCPSVWNQPPTLPSPRYAGGGLHSNYQWMGIKSGLRSVKQKLGFWTEEG